MFFVLESLWSVNGSKSEKTFCRGNTMVEKKHRKRGMVEAEYLIKQVTVRLLRPGISRVWSMYLEWELKIVHI